ncbi:indolepyruvate ferredoxin oxidoreductase family protein [Dactylosporangium sp. NPDC051484]|uniref:indolepyruvate ferredoxin oxidoreductase family protein n=1 Tax=Dactylosporangium sp. NPDC051484 TaxID=3154942 RepID=UPI00344D004D
MATPKGRQHDTALDELDCTEGLAYLTGTDILLRLPAIQRKLDLIAGHNTKGYVSGYPGSPLSGLDSMLRREQRRLSDLGVEFDAAVNEDLAATALWGTQNLDVGGVTTPYDGVFGMWYGKGPGVERSTDPMRTASYFGTAQYGGVLALAGDDHDARSTVTAQQSETLFLHMGMPILSPATLQEFLQYGLAGWALSRYSKLWVGMICLNDLADAAATVDLGALPTFIDPGDRGAPPIQLGKSLLEIEHDIRHIRVPAAQRFARLNQLDRIAVGADSPHRKIGIVVGGKAYLDVIDALARLGLSEEQAAQAGIAVYKVGMLWPLEDQGALEFMRGRDEVIVIEAKHPLVEDQLNRIANRLPSGQRPLIVGKTDERGLRLVPETGGLDAEIVATVLRARLRRAKVELPGLRSAPAEVRTTLSITPVSNGLVRAAGFCSGCPHNTSTRVPAGEMNLGGTGCHAMATMRQMTGRQTEILHHMGGEGAMWIGMSKFADRDHMFQNVGDGTFAHSASLALRGAVAAGVDITYKILVNGFISMTGGQEIPGQQDTPQICRQVLAEGASKVVVVTENPARVRRHGSLPRGVKVVHRRKFLQVEAELAKVRGVSVLIYDQECAAELRRMRKRGKAVDPDKRTYINTEVCEGCGDCNTVSNCISVEPVETSLGRKRRIDQSSCNKDFSCVDGYCPSFVTLYGATPRKRSVAGLSSLAGVDLPDPVVSAGKDTYNIVVGGIGGSGVLTIGAILGRAAFVEGRSVSVLNETGMAQKNGNVQSHVRISTLPTAQLSPRIAAADADLVIGGDIVVASAPATLGLYNQRTTSAVVNRDVKPTVAFADNPDLDLAGDHMVDTLKAATDGRLDLVDANRIAVMAFGDEIYANVLLIGFAAQRGLLPLSVTSIASAIELNGASVEKNLQALRLGRLLAVGEESVINLLTQVEPSTKEGLMQSVAQLVADRRERLVRYQNEAYAQRYLALVEQARAADDRLGHADGDLSRAVATYFFKLMAYKDEYEVARMYTDPDFKRGIREEFEGDFKIKLNLAPQIFNPRDPLSGRARKWEIPFWALQQPFKVMAAMRRLRGTKLDVFGLTEHRRAERRRIDEYERTLTGLLRDLNDARYETVVDIATAPELIRGYDSVKDESAQRAGQAVEGYLRELDASALSGTGGK